MSFKRVGDDFSAIKVQKKLRVSELLLEDIPEDEAALAKNGRFVCLVCGHRPVFDTVAVLSIHRQGKRHLAAAAIKLEEQRKIAELRQKQEHDRYLKVLHSLTGKSKEDDKAPLLQRTQKNKELVLNSRHRMSSVGHSSQQQQASPSRIQKNIPFFQSRIDTKVNFPTLATTSTGSDLQREESKKLMLDSRGNEIKIESESKSSARQIKKETLNIKQVDKQERSHSTGSDTGSHDKKRKLSEYYAKLRASGWILGTDGNWHKDETVEFDSDEDEPPPPPTL